MTTMASLPAIGAAALLLGAGAVAAAAVPTDYGLALGDYPDPVGVGGEFVYSISVTNNGPAADSEPVSLALTLPADVAFVATGGQGWSCTHAMALVTCTRAALTVTQISNLYVTVLAPTTPGTISASAMVQAVNDEQPANNTASQSTTVVGNPSAPDVAVNMTGIPDAVQWGHGFNLGLSVRNDGATPAAGPIEVLLYMSAQLTLDAGALTAPWTCAPQAPIVTLRCQHGGTLGVGAFAPPLSLPVTAPMVSGLLPASVAVVSPNGDSDTSNNVDNGKVLVVGIQAPIAAPDHYQTAQGQLLTIPATVGRLVNDSDADGDVLFAQLVTEPDAARGELGNVGSDGSFAFQPAPGFVGDATFTYRASDGLLESVLTAVTVEVTPDGSGAKPIANPDEYFSNGMPLVVPAATGVLLNDSDPDGQALTATRTSDPHPALGQVTAFNPDGSFTFIPTGVPGTATFDYQASDGQHAPASSTVSIAVNVTQAGQLQAAPDQYETTENTTLTVSAAEGLLHNDTTFDEPVVAVKLSNPNPAHGQLTSFGPDGSFTFVPKPSFFGTASFTYHLTNGGPNPSAVALVTIAVTNVGGGDAPSAVDDSYQTNEGTALLVGAAQGVLANDSDINLDPLSAIQQSGPPAETGEVTMFGANGSFHFMPAPGFTGMTSFTYRADDGVLPSADAIVHINVINVGGGLGPTTNDDHYVTNEGDTLSVAPAQGLLANDTEPENDPMIAVQLTSPAPQAGQLLAFNGDGSFVFQPAPGFFGTASFTYSATDGVVPSVTTSTVTITVVSIGGGEAPIPASDSYQTPDSTPLTVAASHGVLSNDGDPDFDPLTAVKLSDPPASAGQLTAFNADGSFTFMPAPGFFGNTAFTYQATDGTLPSTPTPTLVTISVVLTGSGQAPTAVPDAFQTPIGTPLHVSAVPGLLGNDEDQEGDLIAAIKTGDPDPAQGQVSAFLPDGSFIFVPAPAFAGVATFSYRATDGTHESTDAVVAITVAGAGEPVAPVATPDTYQTVDGAPLQVSSSNGVLVNDWDPNGDAIFAIQPAGPNPSHGTISAFGSDGGFTFIPAPGFVGVATFTYIATDGALDSAPTEVSIAVGSTQDAMFKDSFENAAAVLDISEEILDYIVGAEQPTCRRQTLRDRFLAP